MRTKLELANSNTPVITVSREDADVDLMWFSGIISMAPDEARELARLLVEAADHDMGISRRTNVYAERQMLKNYDPRGST